eukprot:4977569-Amphidinium_carterae.1
MALLRPCPVAGSRWLAPHVYSWREGEAPHTAGEPHAARHGSACCPASPRGQWMALRGGQVPALGSPWPDLAAQACLRCVSASFP